MKVAVQNSILKKYYLPVLYWLALGAAAFAAIKKPAYNWDMLPYMGVVLSYNNNSGIEMLHRQVYSIAKDQVPDLYYQRMADPSNVYRNSIAHSPELFQSQLPFYIVKPLYTRLAYYCYRMGAALPLATVWPSVIAYLLTGFLFFHYCKKYWSIGWAFAGSLLVMLSPPLLTSAGLSTPDALSGFLIFTAVYLLTETRSATGAFVFLLLSVFARLDNILPAAMILTVIFFTRNGSARIPAGKMVLMTAMLLLAYFAVAGNAIAYGWSIFYYPGFVKQLNASYTTGASFDSGGYATLMKTQLSNGFYFSFLSMFLFLTVYYLRSIPFNIKALSLEQVLAILFILIIVLRFLLQPLITDRIYLPYYLSLIAFLIKKSPVLQPQQSYLYDEITV